MKVKVTDKDLLEELKSVHKVASIISGLASGTAGKVADSHRALANIDSTLSIVNFNLGKIAGAIERQNKIMEKLYGLENTKL